MRRHTWSRNQLTYPGSATRVMVLSETTEEPLTLEECRAHLRLDPIDSDGHPDDSLVALYLSAARQACENYLGMSLTEKTIMAVIDSFPSDNGGIVLPFGPVAEITNFSFGEGSDAAVDFTFSPYTNTVYPVTQWPSLRNSEPNAEIRITYRAAAMGSDALGPLPFTIKAAILLQLGHLYENREDVADKPLVAIANGVRSLLKPHQIRMSLA